MKRLIISALVLLYTIFASEVYAKYDIRHISNADGLSNSSVNAICQVENTLVWFGTWDGLNLYDGRDFKVFLPSPEDSLTIANNIIREILELPDHCVWIATDRGVDRYDPSNALFTRFFSSSMRGNLVSENSFHLAVSSSNEIYAFVNSHGLFRFDGSSFNLERHVPDLKVQKAFFDKASILWILADDGILYRDWSPFASKVRCLYYDSREDDIWIQDSHGVRKLGSDQVFPFSGGAANAMDTDGESLFLGTSGGVWKMPLDGGRPTMILEGVPVLSLFCGTQQTVWAGSDMQGVWQLSERPFDLGAVTGFSNGSAVRCFVCNTDGDVAVGTKGAGIFVFTVDGRLKRHVTTRNGLSDNAIYALEDDGEVVWIGGDGNGLIYFDKRTRALCRLDLPDGVDISSVYCTSCENRETLWVGTSGHGLFRLTLDRRAGKVRVVSCRRFPTDHFGSDIVYDVIPDGPSHMLLATRGGGLVRLAKDGGGVTKLPTGAADDILCLARGSDGSVWAGSSMGLFHFGSDGSVRSFTLSDGLPSNTVHGILEDASGGIWVSTNNGLARLDPDKGRIIAYRESDGLQDNEFSDNAFYSDGRYFYFGGIRGYNRFNPLQVADNVYDPKLLLKSIVIDNELLFPKTCLRDVKGVKTLVLQPGTNSVGFTFVPVDYVAGDRCEVSYRLEGFTQDWLTVGNTGNIIFSNLPPGRYTLKVRHSSSDGSWCDDTYSLPVRMLDHWWRTPYAKLAYLLVALAVAFTILQLSRSRSKARAHIAEEEEKRRHNEEIHEAKLDFFTNIAHEFSNSLTLIYGPCEELRHSASITGKEQKYLNAIESNSSRMQNLIQQLISFRKAETGHLEIKITRVDVVALTNNVLDYFREKMSSENISFRLDAPSAGVVWNADGDSLEKIIFNLLSNAVKYTPSGEAIRISLNPSADLLEIDFTNFGVGIPKERQTSIFDRYDVLERFERAVAKGKTSNGIGLALCKNLVELHNGSIEIRSDGSTYTTFHIALPVLPSDESAQLYQGTVLQAEKDAPEVFSTEPAAAAEPPAIKDRVLIADDEEDVLEFLSGILQPRFEVMTASNGLQAWKILQDWEPRVIISDLYMPEMNGAALLQKIRSDERLKYIPFILLSGKGSVDTQIDALERGADAYLAKPFHPRHLLARIDRMLHRDAEMMTYSRSAQSAVEKFAGHDIKKEDRAFLAASVDYIARNLDSETLSADKLAEAMKMSKMQYYRKLKAITGLAPVEFIRMIRLDYAERQLKTTTRTVQQIMFESGFSNKAYFFREFAKRYGMTPGEYRKR